MPRKIKWLKWVSRSALEKPPRVARSWRGTFTVLFAAALGLAGVRAAIALEANEPTYTRGIASPAVSYDWTGFYLGGHAGAAWGSSDWTAGPGAGGSNSFFQSMDSFNEGGSFFAGLQGGYNYLLPNHVLLGAEVDASFPSWETLPTGVNPFGVSIGGGSSFGSPTLGPISYAETVLSSGTVRGRIGYAPGSVLYYATGGLAWSNNQQSLTQFSTGDSQTHNFWRLGWAVGAGVEAPIMPRWTARLEYLYTHFGNRTTDFFGGATPAVISNERLQQIRFGLNYQFGGDNDSASASNALDTVLSANDLSLHGQTTLVWQGNRAFRASYDGPQSLPKAAENEETFDATLYAGLRLWQGAEAWVNPELDQGFGLANTHGLAGYSSAEAYKLGSNTPYARFQRYFIRQTIDLGGNRKHVDADINQFPGSRTENRLVLTVGKFSIADMFDTNEYANNPKSDFLNWSVVNAGTFDYAGDGWGYTYGAAAEWYQGAWTLRGGVFDLSQTPAGGSNNAPAYGLDPAFHNLQWVAEIERRYALGDQPGTVKVTAFDSRGNAGSFADALRLSKATGQDVSDALAAVRHYQSRPGVSVNLAQQVTETLGVFARAGWADGNVEPWDFTDIDRTLQAGVSINGANWGRPHDTLGVATVTNGIAPVHQAYFAAGGMGILLGDGQLNYGLEHVLEAYYSYAATKSVQLSFDYQHIANPGYNQDRGPVNIFAGRFHWTF